MRLKMIDVEKYINEKIKKLKGNRKRKISFLKKEETIKWITDKIREEPGVYLAFEKGKIVYVGETTNLCKRFIHLTNTQNHCLRISIGKDKKACKKGSSRKKCPPHTEKEIDRWLTQGMKFTWLNIPLGRKEIEEKIICSPDNPKYNQKGKKHCERREK